MNQPIFPKRSFLPDQAPAGYSTEETIAWACGADHGWQQAEAAIKELVDSLQDCLDDTRGALEAHLQNYGTNYRSLHAQRLRDQIKVADALIEKHKEPG